VLGAISCRLLPTDIVESTLVIEVTNVVKRYGATTV
jgi:hypothetical protein